MAKFEIIGGIINRETIARGGGIRDLPKLREEFGDGNWRKCKGEAKVEFADGTICDAEIHWHEAHGIGRRREKIKRVLRGYMEFNEENTEVRYAICVSNEGYEMDLVPLKVYAVLPSSQKESELNFLRVIDETGEDYLYSADYFVPVEMSDTDEEDVKRTMLEREAGKS